MRAVLGIALAFGGLLLGYAVLSGKFPATSAASSSSGTSSSGSGLTSTVLPSTGSSSGTPTPTWLTVQSLGLPTMTALAGNDTTASNGGMQ